MNTTDEMKAEAEARWKAERAQLNEQRRAAGLATIHLVHAADEAPTFSREYQAEFRSLRSALHDGGVEAETPFMALDSVEAVSGYTGELIVPFVFLAGSVVTGIVSAWLQKRAGRKIIIRIGDNQIEATTKESLTIDQLNRLVQSISPTEKMESSEEWISAALALRLLSPDAKNEYSAKLALCKYAHKGLVRSRAQQFLVMERPRNTSELPPVFWWAEGQNALTQDWRLGNFASWTPSERLSGDLRLAAGKVHLEAINVSFMRSDIEKMIPADAMPPRPATPTQAGAAVPAPVAVGRPPADWWEDCLIDLCFKHFRGELPHKTQAEIVRAMQDWILAHNYDAAESTIKLRARKLLDAIRRDEVAGK